MQSARRQKCMTGWKAPVACGSRPLGVLLGVPVGGCVVERLQAFTPFVSWVIGSHCSRSSRSRVCASWTALRVSSQDERRICEGFCFYSFWIVWVEQCVCVCVCVYMSVCQELCFKGLSYHSFSNGLQPVLKHASCLNRPSLRSPSLTHSLKLCSLLTHTHTPTHTQTHHIKQWNKSTVVKSHCYSVVCISIQTSPLLRYKVITISLSLKQPRCTSIRKAAKHAHKPQTLPLHN